jgi:raffinose/stachyose/melibiose transport system substrate-binding protein
MPGGLMAVALLAAGPAVARQKISMWFWGASPAYQQALQDNLVTPFNRSQNQYDLQIEYRISVDNDIRVAAIAGRGPDLIYTSGPSNVMPLAKAGKLEPLDAYDHIYGWSERLLPALLNTCRQAGRLYCMAPCLATIGMFYNKAVLAENGWAVPRTGKEVEAIMRAAQAKGMYASVTGNAGWQPVNEDYVTVFLNQIAGPDYLYSLLTGHGDWTSPSMVSAMTELKRWYQSGFLGGSDYFALGFDSALELLQRRRSPFLFGPSYIYQWAGIYFQGADADNLGFAPFPQLNPSMPYPIYSIGSPFTYSINANSKVKDGAAMVLNTMMSPAFAVAMAKVWPGYWAIPLKHFPADPSARGITKSYYQAMDVITGAVDKGRFGYEIYSFFPSLSADIFIQDVEAVWVDRESPQQMLKKVGRAFADKYKRGLTQQVTPATFREPGESNDGR